MDQDNKNWTVVMFPKIQIDTAISYFLLRWFGEAKFPGIKEAHVEFWTELPSGKTADKLEAEGYILIDLGGGKFDHHRLGQDNKTISTATMVAQFLAIDDRPDLQKLLEFARRDDLEGKGTISQDVIDRTFGLSGLLMNLNKTIPGDPHRILNTILPLLTGHYIEENKRYELLPREHQELIAQGRLKEFKATQLGKQLKIIYIESDNIGLAGFLRSRAVGADMVIQRASTGHVNFVSKQQQRLQLKKLARLIKLLEAEKNNILLPIDSAQELERPGRTVGLQHWFYDARANTIQNGGVNPMDIPATLLTYEEIEIVTKDGLNIEREQPKFNRFNNNYRTSKGKGGVVYLD